MGEVINLFTDGKVVKGEREFTRLVGGFGENNPMFLIWQANELLGQDTRELVQNFDRNIEKFNENIDYIDLKSLITENDKTKITDITDFFKSVGVSHNKYGRAKQWLAFSFSGMMKLVKIITTEKSWDIFEDFLEDYFKTKAENASMKLSIEEQIESLTEEKASLLGKVFMAKSDSDRFELMQQVEKKNEQIVKLEKSMSEKHIVEQLSSKTYLADLIENGKSNYDIGVFSKILEVDNMGRNNLFKWLKENKILMDNKVPYQHYMKYFKVIPIVKNGYSNPKTLLKPKGVDYVMKRLIKDGKVVTKSVEQVLQELEQAN